MKIRDIIEDTEAGTNMSGNFASVAFPLFGKEKMIRRAVDPKGYLGAGKPPYTGGYKKRVKRKKNASK